MSRPEEAENYAITGGKLANRFFILTCLISVCLNIGANTANNSIALYLTHIDPVNGASLNGMIAIPFAIAAILARLISGYLADHLSRRTVLVWGLLLFAAAMLPFGIISSVVVLFVLRGVQGFAYSAGNTTLSAATLDTSPPDKVSTASGFFYVPSALSIAVCGIIAVQFSNRGKYGVMFCLLGVTLAVGALLAFLSNYEKLHSFRPAPSEVKTHRGIEEFIERDALRPAAIAAIACIFSAFFNGFMLLYAQEVGMPHSGLFFTVAAIVMLVLNLSAGKLQKWFGLLPLVIFSPVLLGISLVLLSVTGSFAAYLFAAVAYSTLCGCAFPALYVIGLQKIRPERRGAASCTLLVANDIGIGIGTPIWGVVIPAVGYTHSVTLCGIGFGVTAVLSLLILRRRAH